VLVLKEARLLFDLPKRLWFAMAHLAQTHSRPGAVLHTKSEKEELQEQLATTKKSKRDALVSGNLQEAAKQELRAANLTLALRELDLEHLEASSASQPNPVAVAQAKVAVAQAKQEAAEARKDPVAVAEAKLAVATAKEEVVVAIAQAKVAVAQAKQEAVEAGKDPVAVAEAKVAVAEERWLHASDKDKTLLKDILDAARSRAVPASFSAKAEGVAMEHVFKPQGSDFRFVISSVPDAARRFRAQACLDTGSSFTLIMPRRKIAQMGLKCLGPTTPVVANCATGACQLYPYEAVEVSCPDLDKSATMLVYGVSPQQVYGSDQPPETGRKRKSTVELTPKKVTLASTATEQLQTPPRKKTTRNSFSISPCKLDEGAVIDAEILIGRPGLENLGLELDFQRSRVRRVKALPRVRTLHKRGVPSPSQRRPKRRKL